MSTSSDDDDGIDAAKLAALRSVAIDSSAVIQNASAPVASRRKSGKSGTSSGNGSFDARGADVDGDKDSSGLKLYQTRLQDLLYKHLDNTFGNTAGSHPVAPANNQQSRSKHDVVDERERTGGIRLFRRAPPGIVVQPREEKILGPGVKPQLRPSLTLDEDSEEHLVRLKATVVDSETVSEQAKRLREKILASAKSSQVKAEQARKNEEERVAQLKRQRGEEWLPSVAVQIAKEMANEPKLPKVAPAVVQVTAETNTKKKKKGKKVSKAQLGVVLD